jgi:hypothetical protein
MGVGKDKRSIQRLLQVVDSKGDRLIIYNPLDGVPAIIVQHLTGDQLGRSTSSDHTPNEMTI